MRKIFSFLFFATLLIVPISSFAQDTPFLEPSDEAAYEIPKDEFYKAKVLQILEDDMLDLGDGTQNRYQKLFIEVLEGSHKGEKIEFEHGGQYRVNESQFLRQGETFIAMKVSRIDGSNLWVFVDKYRTNSYLLIAGFFLGLTVLLSGFRGFASIIGLATSVGIIAFYMVPKIAHGENPLFVGIVSALLITFLSIFPSHGISKKTGLSIIGILLTLFLAAILAMLAVYLASLSGLGTEEAYYLQLNGDHSFNLRGLLLAGILIGALGVLDDITTTQTAAVEEISRANNKLGFTDLYKRGLSIGRSHIVSLVNTLVLAYAGASLPLLILFTFGTTPLWVILSSEMVGEEIIRTLVGSFALVMAVPISTSIAAWYFSKNPATGKADHSHGHFHSH